MKRRRFSLEVRPGAVVLLSGLYFLLPLRWCARLALTVTVHELGHVTALILCGAQVCGLRMEGCGLVLRCTPTEGALRTVTAALAGPAAGAGLFCILRGLGYIACAELSLLFSCVNLLPVLPLDGGRALYAALSALAGERADARRARPGAAGRAHGARPGTVCARIRTRTGGVRRVAGTFAAGNDLPRRTT